MKKLSIIVLSAAVLAGAAVTFAQGAATSSGKAPAPASSSKKAAPPASSMAVHATKGVVKSVDASTLVITRKDGKGPETTFVLNSSTKREGDIAPGASVDVRYQSQGKEKIATAIVAQAAKPATAAKAASRPSGSRPSTPRK